ncbi:50S ribosomal protein L9 [Boudabousia liubingyangii]|uniref:Large ribosomal subunit protein bL9 n=1 Tax=Boudabousia liubingyangii TaxID=1921764 RepID=A0A1Q5PP83_9ACTO|nr:50S ribosomal protein L9 [Boudabousia liubingyangii]OKL48556.1 50S ribosomal protein L9 [Boudabousia liubingyangii]OKL49408.1 50S ribosomal protein L9 [Boudabousia liubingyangii]
MKLILTHDVANLGQAGSIVEVKDGYGRNYLIPRKLAVKWTKGAGQQLEQMAAARRKREIANLDDARAVRDALQGKIVRLARPATEAGRLFGAVSTEEIAAAIKEQLGQSVDRRKIVIEHPIKTTGATDVTVNLLKDVNAKVQVQVAHA